MSSIILYCKSCKKYTLKEVCKVCKKTTVTTKPAKFSVDDKWGKYRRKWKEEQKAYKEA